MYERVDAIGCEVVRLDCIVMDCYGGERLNISVEGRKDGAGLLGGVPEFIEGG